ncbi:hypothetical protein L2728_11475 [Shewanella chilikensis]|uniref:hypothetical protein n=1 Tax=Shewanella chilikensis TaxID=558541 RepID=UPI00200E2DA6|nr:hypothetical protein [Shewanella chilikensis]MCL1162493.1 hypothetical protein [Shewanella chilikensis]
MAKRNWKKVTANSLRHAMELCLEHARERKNLSVDRVADLMGLPNKWTLYKWLENGRIPAVLIRPFEHACGITLITRYLTASSGQLVIDIPAGKRADASDINALQGSFSDAMGLLIKFYNGQAEADDTLGALTQLMSGIAWHRENVNKSLAPELELFGGDNE